MKIERKYFPYPVMERTGSAYKEFSFNVESSIKKDGYYIILNYSATIADEGLSSLINANQAAFVYHIQCAQTCFRKAWSTCENEIELRIKEDDLKGIVEVCTFIVAKTDIADYSSEGFSSDYYGLAFDIDAGGILAIGDSFQHEIIKELDDITNTSSIFRVKQNPDVNAVDMLVELQSNMIYVVLPYKQFICYNKLSSNSSLEKMFHAMIFIPSLTKVLYDLYVEWKGTGSFGTYDGCHWLQPLINTIEKVYGKTLEELFRSEKVIEVAQGLLKNPMNSAMDMLLPSGE